MRCSCSEHYQATCTPLHYSPYLFHTNNPKSRCISLRSLPSLSPLVRSPHLLLRYVCFPHIAFNPLTTCRTGRQIPKPPVETCVWPTAYPRSVAQQTPNILSAYQTVLMVPSLHGLSRYAISSLTILWSFHLCRYASATHTCQDRSPQAQADEMCVQQCVEAFGTGDPIGFGECLVKCIPAVEVRFVNPIILRSSYFSAYSPPVEAIGSH